MGKPTLWQHLRQTMGRAIRETGQALDRVGQRTEAVAITPHYFYDDPIIYQDHLSRHRQMFPLLAAGRPILSPQVEYIAPCATLIGSVRVASHASIWYGAVLRADYCANAESYRRSDDEILSNLELEYCESNVVSATDVESNSSRIAQEHEMTPTTNSSGRDLTTHRSDSRLSSSIPDFVPDPDRFHERFGYHGGGIFIGPNTNVQDNAIITARKDHVVIGRGVTIGHLAQLHSCQVADYCLIGMGSVIQEHCIIGRESFIAAGSILTANTIVGEGELWAGNPAVKKRDLTVEQRLKLHYQSDEYVKVAATHKHIESLGGGYYKPVVPVELPNTGDEYLLTDNSLKIKADEKAIPKVAALDAIEFQTQGTSSKDPPSFAHSEQIKI
jgi:gamma-carbonic anhydrase